MTPAAKPAAPPISLPEADASRRIPVLIVAAGLIAATVLGFLWTQRKRAARAHAKPDPFLTAITKTGQRLNEIGNEIVSERTTSASAPIPAGQRAVVDLPLVRKTLAACPYFNDPVTVEIPKQFPSSAARSVAGQYPALPAALAQHLVGLDAPFDGITDLGAVNPQQNQVVSVHVSAAAATRVDVAETDSAFEVGLGKRHITNVRVDAVSPSAATVSVEWTFEPNELGALAPEHGGQSAKAELQRGASGWQAARVWRDTAGGMENICP